MQFLRDLSVRGKLFAGFGIVLALTLVLGVVLLSQLGLGQRRRRVARPGHGEH